jgi:hypothetical protein
MNNEDDSSIDSPLKIIISKITKYKEDYLILFHIMFFKRIVTVTDS